MDRTATAPSALPSPAVPTTPDQGEPLTLPVPVGELDLGATPVVCVGEGLTVAEDHTVRTWGWREGKPCVSKIDLTRNRISTTAIATLPSSTEATLEVSDPERSRVYVVQDEMVIAYDCCGNAKGAVFMLPGGEPGGHTAITGLRLNQEMDRLFVSYQDYDGQAWLASTQIDTGEGIGDVPVPSGPWALISASGDFALAVSGGGPWEGSADDGLLIFADTTTLVILDAETLAIAGRVSLSNRIANARMDSASARLFVASDGGDLTVIDATSLVELDRLSGVGSAVDLDRRLGQLYVGDRYSGGVHVLSLDELEPLGTIPQWGRPVASPADGQVYIVAEGVVQADGRTFQFHRAHTARDSGCQGCSQVEDIVLDPRNGLTLTITNVLLPQPGPIAQVAVDVDSGRAFVARTTGGYQPVYSLAAYPDLRLEEPLAWLDGLYGELVYNPSSERLFLAHEDRLLVLDGGTLELVGEAVVDGGLKLLAVDESGSGFYAAQGARLMRWELQGAAARSPNLQPVEGLPGPVFAIVVSPDYSRDSTLYVQSADKESGRTGLFRSRDGGNTWVALTSLLPNSVNDLVVARDKRLYAAVSAGYWRSSPQAAVWGEGVYVSVDNGDTWEPHNAGLTHLRVGRLYAAADGTLYALAAASVEPGLSASGLTIWKRAVGLDWTPVAVKDAGPLRLENYAVPADYTLAVQARWHELAGEDPLYQAWGGELRRSDDGGRSWGSLGVGPANDSQVVVTGRDGLYWLGEQTIWRSLDEGQSWMALDHPVLGREDPLSITPQVVDGVETLFVGTADGQVLIVPLDTAVWIEES